MGKKIRIRQGKKHRVQSHVYVLTETNNTTRLRRKLGKKLVLFVSVNTYTCDFTLCFFPCLILIFFPMLPDSQDFFYFTIFLESHVWVTTQSLVCTSKNCHFIHSFATSFKGRTPFTIFVIHFSGLYIVGLTSNLFSFASQIH